MKITTHVLDTSKGLPAHDVVIILYEIGSEGDKEIQRQKTNRDGRNESALHPAPLKAGSYKLRFETGAYFERQGLHSFYPFVEICFNTDGTSHYHVPLLLSPFGYATYRGS